MIHESMNPLALTGPVPCDGCRHRDHCAATGDACEAFAVYANRGKEPKYLSRVPSDRIGQRLGLRKSAA